jgi:hypothetical protein
MLLIKCGSGCICNSMSCFGASGVLVGSEFYISYFITLANAISKLPKDGTETPKHVGAICNTI